MTKKQVKLAGGQTLVFPEGTSEKVIRDTVKRITTSKGDAEWTSDHINQLIREMMKMQGEVDLERANVDHFGPAIEKLSGTVNDISTKVLQAVDALKKQNDNKTDIIPVLQGVVRQLSLFSESSVNCFDQMSSCMNQTQKSLAENSKLLRALIAVQDENNQLKSQMIQATNELVQITRDSKTKKVIYDDNNRIVGVE